MRQLTEGEVLELKYLRHLIDELESGLTDKSFSYSKACIDCIKSTVDVIYAFWVKVGKED
jgi:hypothetical protein